MFRPREAARAALGIALLAACATVAAQSPRFGLGKPALPAQISSWDIDVRPDGHGLRKGGGTVAQGQVIYDAQCVGCHGTFGEATDFLIIAGGVKASDLKSGRAATLRQSDVIRTLGTKLNHAITLWDYIFRAMPWTAPQSLSADEVYAVTAYVLHLNQIVPAGFELTDSNILSLPMPNRDGNTMEHGMGSVKAQPDVQGSQCMQNCAREVKITSEMPEYARNAHGNLREQFRPLGPLGTIDTSRYDAEKK